MPNDLKAILEGSHPLTCPACSVELHPPPSNNHGSSYIVGYAIGLVAGKTDTLLPLCSKHRAEVNRLIERAVGHGAY